jgi:NAD(P)-dependent dehydrogenase (short-subunit alcohol dehydrogenase family)
MRLEGKVAIVTGAAFGNGRGIARRFAAEGARVALVDLDPERNAETERLIREAGGEAFPLRADVSRREEVEALVRETVGRYGGVDILVANAGVSMPRPFLEMTDEVWDRVIAVNLTGVWLCGQVAARQMVAAGKGGKIVNIASVFSEITGVGVTAYSASKGGVRMLTKAMAVELAPHKVNVNCIGPGIIQTGMSQRISEDPEIRRNYEENVIPWGRIGQPEDIANAALFLASDEADYITGHALFVDGGWVLR